MQVAEHLHNRFSTEEWVAAHVDKNINEIVVTYITTEVMNATRPVVDHECVRDPNPSSALPGHTTDDPLYHRLRACDLHTPTHAFAVLTQC